MNWVDHAVVLWLAFVGPALDVPLFRKLKTSNHPQRRLIVYGMTILSLVGLTALTLASRGSKLFGSPFGPPESWIQILAYSLIGLMFVHTIQVLKYALESDENRLYVHQAFAVLDFVLPTNRSERLWYVPLALSAGVFEEVLFRSFLIHYFGGLPHWVAALASATIFGVAHSYQGWKGILGTFLVALGFTVIVAGTGSLLVAMVVHSLWDLRVLLFMLPDEHRLLKNEFVPEDTNGS